MGAYRVENSLIKHKRVICFCWLYPFIRTIYLSTAKLECLETSHEVPLFPFYLAGSRICIRSAPRRWMPILDACTTTQTNLNSVAKSKRSLREHALFNE